jgi:hypothetical protein
MKDHGLRKCGKNSYNRGSGEPMICKKDEEADSVGNCYLFCKELFKGNGPLCFGTCATGNELCGALCVKNQSCTDEVKKNYTDAVNDIIKYVEGKDYRGDLIDFSQFIKDLVYPICPNPSA